MSEQTSPTERPWVVLDQEQTLGQLPDRTFGPVMRIKFRTAGGTVRTLDVPVTDYTPDKVRELLDQAAETTDAITNL